MVATDFETPQTQCPKCGQWQDDFDGFGVLNCEFCDYCSHPIQSGDPPQCEICGEITVTGYDDRGYTYE